MTAHPATPSSIVPTNHIEVTPGTCGGKPRIAGHRIRVQDVVEWTEQGQSVHEIVTHFPQISMADVYAALAYYHDHREEIDTQIEEGEKLVEEMRRLSPSKLQAKLAEDK